jgi:hypothetical protein
LLTIGEYLLIIIFGDMSKKLQVSRMGRCPSGQRGRAVNPLA